MSKNNHNAGMHFIRYQHSGEFVPDDFNVDYHAKEYMKKKAYSVEKMLKNERNVTSEEINEKLEENLEAKETKNPKDYIESSYRYSVDIMDKLYSSLFFCSIRDHKNLEKTAVAIEDFWKTDIKGDIDDFLYLVTMSRYLGYNVSYLLSIDNDEIKDYIYNYLYKEFDETVSSFNYKGLEYIEFYINLMDYSKERDIAYFYRFFNELIENLDHELMDSIYTSYKIIIYKEKNNDNETEYNVFVALPRNHGYVMVYEAFLYSEKEGKIADYFEEKYRYNKLSEE